MRGLTLCRRQSSGHACSTCWRTCNCPGRSTRCVAGTPGPPAHWMTSGRSSGPAATRRPKGPLPSARAPPRRARRPALAFRRTLAAHNRNPPSSHRPPPGILPGVASSSVAGTRHRSPRLVRRTAHPDRTAGSADSTSGPERPSGCHRTFRRRSLRPCGKSDFRWGKTRLRLRRSRLNYCCNRPRRRRPTSRSRQRETQRWRRNTIGRYSSRAYTVWAASARSLSRLSAAACVRNRDRSTHHRRRHRQPRSYVIL